MTTHPTSSQRRCWSTSIALVYVNVQSWEIGFHSRWYKCVLWSLHFNNRVKSTSGSWCKKKPPSLHLKSNIDNSQEHSTPDPLLCSQLLSPINCECQVTPSCIRTLRTINVYVQRNLQNQPGNYSRKTKNICSPNVQVEKQAVDSPVRVQESTPNKNVCKIYSI